MAEYLIQDTTLSEIADAIRGKTGKTDSIAVSGMADEIASITGGGGSADARVKYVTFMSEDGLTELIKYPVISGDTCHDPVTKGLIETPTKESTASQVFTYNGWATASGGSASASALTNVTEDRTVYVAFAESVRTYAVRFYDGDTLIKTEQVPYGGSSSYVYEKDGYLFKGWQPEAENITADTDCYAQLEESLSLEAASWARISELSASGEAELHWAVGDTKSVLVNGTVGTRSFNQTLYVYIIGFNHNESLEGTGIHFGTFKDANGKDICLRDSYYNTNDTSGAKRFSWAHYRATSVGGWGKSDIRYDILGSVDVAPSDYGSEYGTSAYSYPPKEPSATCATSPKANTLMSALPADLRAVMKPMTKYTDNTVKTSSGNANSGYSSHVTASIDYLPLLTTYELGLGVGSSSSGTFKGANMNEADKCKVYDYYSFGGSKLKYAQDATSTQVYYWTRSPYLTHSTNTASNTNGGCSIYNSTVNSSLTTLSLGIAPIFKV